MSLFWLVILILFILLVILWLLNKLARNAEQAQAVGSKIRTFWERVRLGWTLLLSGWHDQSKLKDK